MGHRSGEGVGVVADIESSLLLSANMPTCVLFVQTPVSFSQTNARFPLSTLYTVQYRPIHRKV